MKKLHVDIARCTACYSCEIACALEHTKSKDIVHAIFETPLPKRRVSIVTWGRKFYPLVCRRCDEPRCVDACIAAALVKEGGELVYKEDRCVGCWSCILACPYSAILRRSDSGKISLCDLCLPSRQAGNERPSGKRACEEACPTRCIFYGEEKDFLAFVNEREAIKQV